MVFNVAAGEEWDDFVARAVDENCAGIECLSGIPGSVGATPVQNVGAYGQEVSETIREVDALDRQSLQLRTFTNAECGFGYRTSIFNTTERDRYIILRVSFSLRRGGKPTIRYADLQKAFGGASAEPTLAEVRAAVREIRHRKAMLIVPGDDDARSAGSFFKNPDCSCSINSMILRRSCARAVSSCRVIPQARDSASFRQRGWSSTPDSPRATAAVRPGFPAGTRWRS